MINVISTIGYKASKTNSSFHVRERATGKVESLFFGTFLLVLIKFLFWQGGWALSYHSDTFLIFPNFLRSLKF